jgi:hypothetical protein
VSLFVTPLASAWILALGDDGDKKGFGCFPLTKYAELRDARGADRVALAFAVGLCTLNQVDP